MDTRTRNVLIGGGVAVVVAVIVAVIAGLAGGTTISGKVTVTSSLVTPSGGSSCTTDGVFSDIHEDAKITVYDMTGNVIGNGRLGAGQGNTTQSPMLQCVFPYTVSGLPSGHVYMVQVGIRDKVSFTATEATSGAANIGITG